jgi:hypothetical protein
MISKFPFDLQAVFYTELVHTAINYLLTKYHAVGSSDCLVSVFKPKVKTIFRSAQKQLRVFRESAIVLNFSMLN